MFNGKFIGCNSIVSKKDGAEYYQLEVIATTVDGGAKVLQSFCTRQAYDSALGLTPMQDCKIACGVTNKGHITICGIKGV